MAENEQDEISAEDLGAVMYPQDIRDINDRLIGLDEAVEDLRRLSDSLNDVGLIKLSKKLRTIADDMARISDDLDNIVNGIDGASDYHGEGPAKDVAEGDDEPLDDQEAADILTALSDAREHLEPTS